MSEGALVIDEDFSQGMPNWWVEGGEQVWVADGRLYMRSEGPDADHGSVCTAWCKTPHPAHFVLEAEAHVLKESKGPSNNINLFFCYADPSGVPLFETRQTRRNGDYGLYHALNGHIITFVNGREETGLNADGTPKARVRIRRCPGFQLLAETFAYHSLQDHTYRLRVTKRRGHISFAVDGKTLQEASDAVPLGGGLLGLRTFKTFLWWDNVKLTALPEEL